MIKSIFLNYSSSILFINYIKLTFSVTSTIFSEVALYVSSTQTFIPHDFLSDFYHENPENWREKLEQAPAKLLQSHREKFKNTSVLTLQPKYVVGLVDAEGCFSVSFLEQDLKMQCEFSLMLIYLDKDIIEALQAFFKVGMVKKQNDDYRFVVSSDWQLYYSIIPFFEQHSLLGSKRKDFLLFKEVVKLKVEGKFFIQSKITRPIIKMRVATYIYTFFCDTDFRRPRNLSLEQIQERLGIRELDLPLDYYNQVITWMFLREFTPYINPDPWYMTGFCEGDGGCSATITKEKVTHTYQVSASQIEILKMMQRFWSFGVIYFIDLTKQNPNSKPHWRILINRREDLRALYDNHLGQFPMLASKQKYYNTFMEFFIAVEKGEHLIPGNRRNLDRIIYDMNLDGKRRRRERYE